MFGRTLVYIFIILGVGAFLIIFGPVIVLSMGLGGTDLSMRTPMNDEAAIGEDISIEAPTWTLRPSCTKPSVAAKARVHAVTLTMGDIETPVQEFGTPVGQVNITVTDKSGPVYLILAARNAVVWNLRTAPNVILAGVVTTGFDRQTVVTRQSRVTVLPASIADELCHNVFRLGLNAKMLNAVSADELTQMSVQAFGRAPDNLVEQYAADTLVLGPAEDAAALAPDPDPFAVPDILAGHRRPILFGRPALARLVAEGILAPATADDVAKWRAAGPLSPDTPSYITDLDLARTYLVRRPFRLPLGLTGEAAAAFILPAGVKVPDGWIGENVYFKYTPYGCAVLEGWKSNCDKKDIGVFNPVGYPLKSAGSP